MNARNEETSIEYELVIRNANLDGNGSIQDIGISAGKIKKIRNRIPVRGKQEIDAGGGIVTPPFIDPHTHLDKAYLKPARNHTGTLEEAIEIMRDYKGEGLIATLDQRVEQAIKRAIVNGTLAIRTHVDISERNATVSLERLVAIKEKVSPFLDLQIVAFPQEGLINQRNVLTHMKAAMTRGADLVGGIPAIEENPKQARQHIEKLFDLAAEFNRDVDMHIDETDDPASRTLEMLADITLDAGWRGRVSAAHCCSLSSYEDSYAWSVIQKVAEAQINIITNPQVNLVLQGRHDRQPIRRGITRVKELLSAGINVTCGQDNVQDVFYPFGNLDMLEVAFIAALTAQLTGEDEIRSAFNMPRYNAAICVNLKDYGIVEGAPANLVILPVRTVVEALALRPPRSAVIRNGQVISSTKEIVEVAEDVWGR